MNRGRGHLLDQKLHGDSLQYQKFKTIVDIFCISQANKSIPKTSNKFLSNTVYTFP